MPRFITVEMLESKKGSPDGKKINLYQKGEVYDLPSNGKNLLGDKFLDRKLCKKVEKEDVPEESQEDMKTMDEEPEESTGDEPEKKTMAQKAKEKLTGKGKDKKKK